MKSLIICLAAMFISFGAFSQKAKQNFDTTLKSYLTYSCSMHPQYVSNVPAKCPVCNDDMTLSKKEQMKAEVVKLYTCSMDNVICTTPGKCPKCNMEMVEFKPKKSGSN
jgi:putative DNA topoisomerase